MTRYSLMLFVHFFVLVLIQIFVLNNIFLFKLVHPYIYLYFILILPLNLQKSFVLLISFGLGLMIDILSSTYGINAIACTFIGFIRPGVVSLFTSEPNPEEKVEPHIRSFGLRAFFFYVFLMTFLHHFVLFLTEVFGFRDFGFTLLKVLLSTFISIIVMFIYELFMFFKQRED